MSLSRPFYVTVLNKASLHPLQAASDHCGRKLFEMDSKSLQNTTHYLPAKRLDVVALDGIVLPEKDSAHYTHLPEFLRIRKNADADATRNARNSLWLRVAWRETRADAQYGRRFELTLPPELPLLAAENALRRFAQEQLVAEGMVVDLAIHETLDRRPDSEAPVAVRRQGFLMCTTRPFENGEFAKNKPRHWNERKTMLAWRHAWFKILTEAIQANPTAPTLTGRKLLDLGRRVAATSPGTKLSPEASSMTDANEVDVGVEQTDEAEAQPKPRRPRL